MRLAGIVRDSIVDGIGVRDVVFFQGCPHHCEGCHNPQTWDYMGGEEWTVNEVLKELSNSSNNVTISGGEPLEYAGDVKLLAMGLRHQGKRVWVYTGYKFNPELPVFQWLKDYVDVVVDGQYVQELRDTNLRFRGSSNQRLIDLPKSMRYMEAIEWEDVNE